MHTWINCRLIVLLILGVILFGMGYQYALHFKNQNVYVALESDVNPPFLQEVKLPSTVPNFRLASKRHAFLPVELRRADLVLGMNDQDTSPKVAPVLDKVLFVPKKFKRKS